MPHPPVPAAPPVLLVAAHGTQSADGSATTRALVEAVRARAGGLPVRLCFLDVAEPRLADALDDLGPTPVVIVPLQLTAGFHVHTDIPAVVQGRTGVRVAAHLGPDPLLLRAVADRLRSAASGQAPAVTTVLAGVGSSRASARAELELAAARLGEQLGRAVQPTTIDDGLRERLVALAGPVEIASYLLATGTFDALLRTAAAGVATVGEPVGTHPKLVELILARYRAALTTTEATGEVG